MQRSLWSIAVRLTSLFFHLVLFGINIPVLAGQNASWGHAESLAIDYQPKRVLYDIDTESEAGLINILDRVSLLDKHYGSDPFDGRIVVVLHGKSIPFFAIRNTKNYHELMSRAASLTYGGSIDFRMCQTAARGRYGLEAKDIHGFVKMVPMADAEIVRLQAEEGYAYMR
jgi:intracellular sulfur oxidation DsrE/DsrF family protein